MEPGDVISLLIVAVSAAAVLILRGPLGRAMARRLEGAAGREGPTGADMAGIAERVAELEQRDTRIAELEERLDFAERMLTQQREAERLPRGRDD
jgi:hypothetical protein